MGLFNLFLFFHFNMRIQTFKQTDSRKRSGKSPLLNKLNLFYNKMKRKRKTRKKKKEEVVYRKSKK